MLTNNKLKTLLVAASALTLMACESGPTQAERDAEKERLERLERERQAQADQEAREKQAQAEAAAAAELQNLRNLMEQEKAALEAKNTIYFDFDRSTIKSEFQSVLRQHAAFLVKNTNQRIVIQGHTDSRGTPEYNIALGERRAKAVETFLRNEGVRSSQISVVSFGEEKPAVMGTSEYAFAQNRRAEVVFQ